ncbi:MAG: hypothetical protein QME94_19790, partial [Anaerolineae bacterium]|nr:hypothetical protein [Anaerolineae bacterium]
LGEAAAAPTATLSTPGPGVADLLAAAPAPWERVEVDAYYSGAGALHLRGGPRPPSDQVVCPDDWAAALTDRPFPATLQLLNSVHSNALPADGAWLVAVTPEAATPGVRTVAQLPYHARLRGHLGDPAFVHCANAERIFVVEEVVKVYEDQPPGGLQPAYPRRLPEGYASWPRHLEPTLGYSLPYPPDWQAQRLDGATVSFSAPAPPGYALVVRVHEGEVRYDQYDPASLPPLLQGSSMGVFEQGWSFDEPVEGSQRLTGYTVEREGAPDERSVSVLFAAHGRTYELSLRYPLGYAARQPLLTVLSAMVEGFRLDRLPPPSPTPPIRQELGPGPFLSVEEALERARRSQGVSLQLLHARLVSEAEARQVLGTGPCATFMGHPEGVWLLTVEGLLEGKARTMLLVLDAKTGQQLCGEEIDPAAGPLPGVTGPALTLTEGTRPGWQRLTSEEFAVSLELPANWEQVPGDPYRFVGSDGFLLLNAGMAPGSLDEVARQHADHKLKPFGSDPTFRALTVDG